MEHFLKAVGKPLQGFEQVEFCGLRWWLAAVWFMDQRQQLWSSSPTGSHCSDPGMDDAGLDWDYDRGGASGQA